MASVNKIDIIQLHTTPAELRNLAIKMEVAYERLRLGDPTRVENIDGRNLTIELHLDQERMVSEIRDNLHKLPILWVHPRNLNDRHSIHELALDIKTRGMMNPIIVDETLTIIDGHHRYYACKVAGLKYILVQIRRM